MRRLVLLLAALSSPALAEGPRPTWTVDPTPTSVTVSSSAPGTVRISAAPGAHPGEVSLTVDLEGDGKPEFSLGKGVLRETGVTSIQVRPCVAEGFVPEFESLALLPKGVREGRPVVSVERYPDGNLRILLDANRDGTAEAEALTRFALATPERAPTCVAAFPVAPSVPDPRTATPDPG